MTAGIEQLLNDEALWRQQRQVEARFGMVGSTF